MASAEHERERTALKCLFPVGTAVEAFHPQRLRMEEGRVSGYLGDPSPYAVVVTFADATTCCYYRAYINIQNPARSLVVRRER
jgi:hypothetical protein